MKNTLIITFSAILLFSCNNKVAEVQQENETTEVAMIYQPYGEEISEDGAVSGKEIQEKFENLKAGDTITLKLKSQVEEVCQKKGCWVKFGNGEDQIMMRFKDYAFFMPKDLAGKTVIAEGQAYLEELSVDALKHYAEDGGATEEEIEAITEPKLTYTFKAHGVLVPEDQIN